MVQSVLRFPPKMESFPQSFRRIARIFQPILAGLTATIRCAANLSRTVGQRFESVLICMQDFQFLFDDLFLDFLVVRPPTKCNCCSQLGPYVWSCRIYGIGFIVIFIFRHFGLKLPIHTHRHLGVVGAYSPKLCHSLS